MNNRDPHLDLILQAKKIVLDVVNKNTRMTVIDRNGDKQIITNENVIDLCIHLDKSKALKALTLTVGNPKTLELYERLPEIINNNHLEKLCLSIDFYNDKAAYEHTGPIVKALSTNTSIRYLDLKKVSQITKQEFNTFFEEKHNSDVGLIGLATRIDSDADMMALITHITHNPSLTSLTLNLPIYYNESRISTDSLKTFSRLIKHNSHIKKLGIHSSDEGHRVFFKLNILLDGIEENNCLTTLDLSLYSYKNDCESRIAKLHRKIKIQKELDDIAEDVIRAALSQNEDSTSASFLRLSKKLLDLDNIAVEKCSPTVVDAHHLAHAVLNGHNGLAFLWPHLSHPFATPDRQRYANEQLVLTLMAYVPPDELRESYYRYALSLFSLDSFDENTNYLALNYFLSKLNKKNEIDKIFRDDDSPDAKKIITYKELLESGKELLSDLNHLLDPLMCQYIETLLKQRHYHQTTAEHLLKVLDHYGCINANLVIFENIISQPEYFYVQKPASIKSYETPEAYANRMMKEIELIKPDIDPISDIINKDKMRLEAFMKSEASLRHDTYENLKKKIDAMLLDKKLNKKCREALKQLRTTLEQGLDQPNPNYFQRTLNVTAFLSQLDKHKALFTTSGERARAVLKNIMLILIAIPLLFIPLGIRAIATKCNSGKACLLFKPKCALARSLKSTLPREMRDTLITLTPRIVYL